MKSSGKRWAEPLYDILEDIDFIPSQADPCIWLRRIQNSICMNTLQFMLTIYALLHKIQKN